MDALKEVHDKLLAMKPEEADHNAQECAFCNENLSKEINTTEGGDMKTYTEDEFTTAVTEAVAPLQAAAEAKVAELQAQLDELLASKANEEAEGQIAEVRSELDKAELRATTAEEKYDALVAYLEAVEAEKTAAEALEARKTEIRTIAKETVGFKDEHIELNLDRWAAMSEDVFAAVVEDWKQIKESASATTEEKEEVSTEVIPETAISTVRDENTKTESAAMTVHAARRAGVDVRNF